ncbi:hypothetical protein ACH3XW_16045 [Acanthocheilonema viteae]
MERGRRLRRGMVPMLERRTVWRDCSLSPAVERDQYVAESTLSYQNRSGRRGNFTINESNSPSGHQRHRHRERLDDNNELRRSRISPTSVRTGPMENREYLKHELTKDYRGRDRLIALDKARSEEVRSHDEINRNTNRIQPSEYGAGRMQNYYVQTESQLATEGIAGKFNNNLSNWRIEDLLEGQSMLNVDSIQNAQTWITNDNSLSPAQVVRARELLQELLITITTKPDMPIAGRNVPTTMRQSIYIAEHSFPEDRQSNFAGRRISDYTSSRSFSQQNTQSPLRSDIAVHGRELSAMQNSLPLDVPLTLPTQNWRDDSVATYSDSSEMPMNSREMPKNSDFRPEKRRPHYQDCRRTSRSRSRSLGKDCDMGIGERRVHMKSRGFISVEVNHQQKGPRRNYVSYEISHNRHRENRGERCLRRSSPLMRTVRRRRR